MAAQMIFDLEIWIEGSDEAILVRADQRDMAAFENEYLLGTQEAIEKRPMVLFRYLGWSALRRQGKAPTSKPERETWLEKVISVEPLDGQELDPTSPAA